MGPWSRTELTDTYLEHVGNQVEQVEEGVEEGATCHTAPVLAQQAREGVAAVGFEVVVLVPEVPLYGISRHHKVDYIF